MKKILVLGGFLGLLLGGITAFAQTKKVIADKIIGKVGDRIILKSDVENAIADNARYSVITRMELLGWSGHTEGSRTTGGWCGRLDRGILAVYGNPRFIDRAVESGQSR